MFLDIEAPVVPRARRDDRLVRGAALIETALLLPLYCFLCVGIIYFGNTILLHQEVNLSTRYQSTGMGRPASGGGTSDAGFLPTTGGQYLADAWFIQFAGDIDMSNSQPWVDASDPYDSREIHEELVKISWDVQRTFDLNGNETTTQQYTSAGQRIYGEDILADAPLISERLNGWFQRRNFHYDVTHSGVTYYDTEWGHNASWGLRGLPPPEIDTTVAAVARTGVVRAASASTASPKPVESEVIGDSSLFLETFDDWNDIGSFNQTPVPIYPGAGTSSFWVPN
ncbi:MAG: pilus assembly protein [Planctomycetes bacterium]|nr:pilus assembly protein [Planctomycetota bacterium]